MKSARSQRTAAHRPGTRFATLLVAAFLLRYVTFALPVEAQTGTETPAAPETAITTPPPETPADLVIPTEVPVTDAPVETPPPTEAAPADNNSAPEPEVIVT